MLFCAHHLSSLPLLLHHKQTQNTRRKFWLLLPYNLDRVGFDLCQIPKEKGTSKKYKHAPSEEQGRLWAMFEAWRSSFIHCQ